MAVTNKQQSPQGDPVQDR